MNLGVPSAAGLADGLRTVFLTRRCRPDAPSPRSSPARGFDLDAYDLLLLQLLEDPIQNALLGAPIHACVNRVPVAESARKTAPFTALFGHIQDCIDYLKVRQPHIAALNRQAIFDPLVLLRSDLHMMVFIYA
jgi:hypothetical protein